MLSSLLGWKKLMQQVKRKNVFKINYTATFRNNQNTHTVSGVDWRGRELDGWPPPNFGESNHKIVVNGCEEYGRNESKLSRQVPYCISTPGYYCYFPWNGFQAIFSSQVAKWLWEHTPAILQPQDTNRLSDTPPPWNLQDSPSALGNLNSIKYTGYAKMFYYLFSNERLLIGWLKWGWYTETNSTYIVTKFYNFLPKRLLYQI